MSVPLKNLFIAMTLGVNVKNSLDDRTKKAGVFVPIMFFKVREIFAIKGKPLLNWKTYLPMYHPMDRSMGVCSNTS